jgi:hypothetical protein
MTTRAQGRQPLAQEGLLGPPIALHCSYRVHWCIDCFTSSTTKVLPTLFAVHGLETMQQWFDYVSNHMPPDDQLGPVTDRS